MAMDADIEACPSPGIWPQRSQQFRRCHGARSIQDGRRRRANRSGHRRALRHDRRVRLALRWYSRMWRPLRGARPAGPVDFTARSGGIVRRGCRPRGALAILNRSNSDARPAEGSTDQARIYCVLAAQRGECASARRGRRRPAWLRGPLRGAWHGRRSPVACEVVRESGRSAAAREHIAEARSFSERYGIPEGLHTR